MPSVGVCPAQHPPRRRPCPLSARRLNREHKETCEMDWSDKVEAYNIDEACCRYNNQSTDVQFYPHSAKFEERWGCEIPPGLPVPPLGGLCAALLLLGWAGELRDPHPSAGHTRLAVPAGLHRGRQDPALGAGGVYVCVRETEECV